MSGSFSPRPGVLGVVPVRGSLKPELMKVMEPHLDVDAHFTRHERFLVIPCVCKREQEVQHGHSCRKPMKRCGFVGLPPQTPLGENVLDREAASKLLDELSQMGHVQLAFYGFTMGRRPLSSSARATAAVVAAVFSAGPTHLGLQETAQRSNYRAVIDPETCAACGVCIERCPVDAIAEDENRKAKVDRAKCIGCGVCVIGCATDAIVMEPVPAEEWFHVPSSMAEWEEMRLRNMAADKEGVAGENTTTKLQHGLKTH